MGLTLFFDTYALMELVKGNPAYEQFADSTIVTTRLNLMEFHYGLLRTSDKETADRYFDALLPHAINVSDALIKQSNLFKYRQKDRRLSYVDAISYTFACALGIPFLTGDKQFEDLPNVEYVK